MDTDAKTLENFRKHKSAENGSHSRVVLAPDQLTADELHENTRPMTMNEIIRDYPISKAQNLAQIRPRPATEVIILAKSPINQEIHADQPKNTSDQPILDESTADSAEPIMKGLDDLFADEEPKENPRK